MIKEKLAKNTVFYVTALALQKVLAFLYFIIVARFVGVEDIGRLTFALSFTAVFGMVLDAGLTQVLIRDSARNEDSFRPHLKNAIFFKLFGTILVYGLIVLMMNLLHYPELTKQLVYISGLVMICDSFSLTFFGVIRGYHSLGYESLGVIINQVLIIIFGLIVLNLHLSLLFLVGVYLISSFVNMVYSGAILKFKFKTSLFPAFNRQAMLNLLKMALPFAIAGVFVKLYSSMDIILLSKMATEQAVGFYSVAYKVAFALQFIGVASLASVYPAFSAFFVSSKELLAKTFERVLFYMLLFSLPLTFGVISIAKEVIGPVFGAKYLGSINSLYILMCCLPFAFLCFPAGAILNAAGRQTTNTVILGITAISNIVLNLILIPKLSLIGSSIAALVSYLIMFGISMIIIDQVVKYNIKFLVVSTGKIILSCIAMSAIVILIRDQVHFIVAITVGAIVYFIALYFLKAISIPAIKEMVKTLTKKTAVENSEIIID